MREEKLEEIRMKGVRKGEEEKGYSDIVAAIFADGFLDGYIHERYIITKKMLEKNIPMDIILEGSIFTEEEVELFRDGLEDAQNEN